MSRDAVILQPIGQFGLWEKMKAGGGLLAIELEITARCNNDCRHCYINLPAGDRAAESLELTLEEIGRIADEAMSLGALWCLLTGGEPLLREDFEDIYLLLRKKGLLVGVFTNGTLIRERHVRLFRAHPPRLLEMTIYGATRETYERVTRKPGSFHAFMGGLDLLSRNGLEVSLKAVAIRSNRDELARIAAFARGRGRGHFRFDPLIHLRFDGDPLRNAEIREERLSAEEIVQLERADPVRFEALGKECAALPGAQAPASRGGRLFACAAGHDACTVSSEGLFRLCSSLWHPDCVYDLRKGSLIEAWRTFAPRVREMRPGGKDFQGPCAGCPLINLCMWCPAHAYLENGTMEEPVDYFCRIAHARAESVTGKSIRTGRNPDHRDFK